MPRNTARSQEEVDEELPDGVSVLDLDLLLLEPGQMVVVPEVLGVPQTWRSVPPLARRHIILVEDEETVPKAARPDDCPRSRLGRYKGPPELAPPRRQDAEDCLDHPPRWPLRVFPDLRNIAKVQAIP